MAALPKLTFSVALFLFQIMLLALFAKYAKYQDANVPRVNTYYPRKIMLIFFKFYLFLILLKTFTEEPLVTLISC